MLVMKASKLEEVGPIQPEATGQAGNSAFPGSEAVGVDKIRDLLFGNQMQDYDRRFSMLEERFLQRFREIESEAARNLSSFESSAKKQMESLAAQLREEKDLRTDADKEIDRIQREHNDTVEKRLRSISEQLSKLEREQADRLTQEVQSLREEIKRRNEDLQHTIEKMFAELSNVKTDRNLLASLFLEIARCLNQDVGPKSVVKAAAEPTRGWVPS
jgi:chromosome segregation ATPase